MSDHLADEIERMNTRWMPLVAERLWLCSQADSQVALRRRVRSLVASMSLRTNLQQRILHHQSGRSNCMHKIRSDNVLFQESRAVETRSCDLDTYGSHLGFELEV